MAGDEERLIVLLEAKVRDFEKNLQKASGTADRNFNRMRKNSRSATQQMEADMVRSTTRINQALASTSTQIGAQAQAYSARLGPLGAGMSALGPAGLMAAAGIGALVLGLGKGISSAAEAERIFKRLDAVLKLAGNSAGLSAKDIDGFAANLERTTGIAKNEINAAAAALATYTNISGERFKGVIKLSTDMVAVYGGNLREWSDKIARAIDDPIQGFAALKRAGFQLTDAQLETVEAMRKVGDVAGYQSEMIKILSDSLGGAAGAENTGVAGAAGRAKRGIGAFFEELSRWTGVGPAVNSVLNGVADGLEHIAETAERKRKIELDVGINTVRLNAELIAIEDRLESIARGEEGIVPDSTMTALHSERTRLTAEIEALIERGHREVNELITVETGERVAQWGAATDLINDNAKAAGEAAKAYLTTQEKLTALGTAYDDTKGKIAQARELWKASAADIHKMTAEEKAAYEERGAAIDAWAAAEEDAHARQQASLQRQIAAEAKRAESKSKTRDEVKNLISELEHEIEMVGKSSTVQRIANELRRLGAKATKEQRDEIAFLITELDRQTEAQKTADKAREDFARGMDQMSSDVVDALGQVISGTENAGDAFKRLAIEIVKSALTGKGAYADFFSSLTKGGGSGGFLSSLFGGMLGGGGLFGTSLNNTTNFTPGLGGGFAGVIGYSSGTANTGGQKGQPRGIVHGQEAVIPLPSGGKVPVQVQGAKSGGGGETRVKVDVGVSVDKSGNLQAFVREISQQTAGVIVQSGLREYDREILPSRVNAIAADPYARG